MPQSPTTGYAPAGGADVYWESRGQGGTPLIVVHGGFGLASMFGGLLDELAGQRQVIAVELQGHGHTRDTSRPFSFGAFGDDIAAVAAHLKLAQADLLGYSLGGSVCLRAAIQHPGLIRRLVVAAAPCRRDGWYPEVLAGMDQISSTGFDQMKLTPMYGAWAAVAPDNASFPALMDKTGDLLRQPYDWTDEVRQLPMPTLLVFSDADSIPVTHAAEFYALLGGGLRDAGWDGSQAGQARLAILSGLTHYNAFASPQLASAVAGFIS